MNSAKYFRIGRFSFSYIRPVSSYTKVDRSIWALATAGKTLGAVTAGPQKLKSLHRAEDMPCTTASIALKPSSPHFCFISPHIWVPLEYAPPQGRPNFSLINLFATSEKEVAGRFMTEVSTIVV